MFYISLYIYIYGGIVIVNVCFHQQASCRILVESMWFQTSPNGSFLGVERASLAHYGDRKMEVQLGKMGQFNDAYELIRANTGM